MGLSQEKLSVAAELDRTFVSKIERNGRNPTLESVFKIATALEMEPEELVRQVRKRAETVRHGAVSAKGKPTDE